MEVAGGVSYMYVLVYGNRCNIDMLVGEQMPFFLANVLFIVFRHQEVKTPLTTVQSIGKIPASQSPLMITSGASLFHDSPTKFENTLFGIFSPICCLVSQVDLMNLKTNTWNKMVILV